MTVVAVAHLIIRRSDINVSGSYKRKELRCLVSTLFYVINHITTIIVPCDPIGSGFNLFPVEMN